jgi:hypothetical protein
MSSIFPSNKSEGCPHLRGDLVIFCHFLAMPQFSRHQSRFGIEGVLSRL